MSLTAMLRNLLVIMSAHHIPAYWAVKNSGSSRPWQNVCFLESNLLFMSTDWSSYLLCMEQKEAILDGLELKICWGITELAQVDVDTWIRLVQTFVLSILSGSVFCSPFIGHPESQQISIVISLVKTCEQSYKLVGSISQDLRQIWTTTL